MVGFQRRLVIHICYFLIVHTFWTHTHELVSAIYFVFYKKTVYLCGGPYADGTNFFVILEIMLENAEE